MPRKPLKPCTWPQGCTNLSEGARCPEHAVAAWNGSTRRARLPKDWPKIRVRILRRDAGRCTWLIDGVRCTAPATDVDHVIPGDDHSDANLTSLCAPHHRLKTATLDRVSRGKVGKREG